MHTPVPSGSNLTVDSRSPLRAEQDVADYFRDEVAHAADTSSAGWWSRLLGWLSPSTPPDKTAATAAAPPNRKVLVVDDDPDWAEALVGMFHKCGYPAEAATSADQATAAIRAAPPAVVLLDIMMPGTDGVDLLRALRADPATSKLPVLMVTANHRRMLDSFTSGAQDYLLKPVDWPKVRERVDHFLD